MRVIRFNTTAENEAAARQFDQGFVEPPSRPAPDQLKRSGDE